MIDKKRIPKVGDIIRECSDTHGYRWIIISQEEALKNCKDYFSIDHIKSLRNILCWMGNNKTKHYSHIHENLEIYKYGNYECVKSFLGDLNNKINFKFLND